MTSLSILLTSIATFDGSSSESAVAQASSGSAVASVVLIASLALIVALGIGALVHRKFVRGRLPRGEFRR